MRTESSLNTLIWFLLSHKLEIKDLSLVMKFEFVHTVHLYLNVISNICSLKYDLKKNALNH